MSGGSPADGRILRWLDTLADLTRSGEDRITPDKLAIYAAMLARDGLPPEAFGMNSLHAVSDGMTFFPAYAELRRTLLAWWRDNKPLAPALDGPPGMRLSTEDRQWLAFWRRRLAENFGATATHPASNREHVASLIQQHAPDAWAAIIGIPRRTGTRPPAEEELAHVDRLLAPVRDSFHPESQANRPPLPDAALKGEALARARAARGVAAMAEPTATSETE